MARKKILVIDDEPDVISYLSVFLEDQGYEILSTRDGSEGITRALQEAPDLITLDVTMPGMSGMEVFTALRHHPALKKIPVILVTGVGEIGKLLSYQKVPMPERIMQKPIDRDLLVQMIGEVLEASSSG